MKEDTAEAIVKAAGEFYIEASVYRNYSGRGMCGATTTAVAGPNPCKLAPAIAHAAVGICQRLGYAKAQQFIEDLSGLRADSLGYETITY